MGKRAERDIEMRDENRPSLRRSRRYRLALLARHDCSAAAIKRRIRRAIAAPWQWQPGCFDRLLRRDEPAQDKWLYMRENPVREGLVDRWQDWPYRVGFEM